MASGRLGFKEKLVTCPYNAAHSIDPLRMPMHLLKCRKQYPDVKMSICPFNASHHVREENLPAHIKDCKDKEIVERDIFIRENPDILSDSLQVQYDQDEIQNCESWDSEIKDAVSYNPEANVIYKDIVRQPPPGLGKAGRRLWYEVDQERVKRLQEGKPIGDLIYPSVGGGEISINEIVGESSGVNFSEFRDFLLEKNPNAHSSPRQREELVELPRPKNLKKLSASKYSDTESEGAFEHGFSLSKIVSKEANEEECEDVIGWINEMSVTNKKFGKSFATESDVPDFKPSNGLKIRDTSAMVAHRMILKNLNKSK